MKCLTEDIRRTQTCNPKPIPTGLDSVLYTWAGKKKNLTPGTKSLMALAEQAYSDYSMWEFVGDGVLRGKLLGMKHVFQRRKKGFEEHLPEALSLIGEAAYRTLGLRPFAVQLAGAMSMYDDNIIEMATGEGKTLVAALTGVLLGWSGFPCHIITVNDYLAKRDAEKMTPLYEFCKLTVGCVTSELEPDERRSGYLNDMVYTTSKELTADFLRDRLILKELQNGERRQIKTFLKPLPELDKHLVMKGIHTVIIDEADSLLIDEAVTPLIIAKPLPNDHFVNACKAINAIAENFERGIHYLVNEQYREIELLPKIEETISLRINELPSLFKGKDRRNSLLKQALIAREFYIRDKQYVIQDGKLVIVDEFTGRLMHGRTWREGLHQLVEAKENIEVTSPTETLARLSFQRFFRFFKKMSGMTGTAWEAKSELWHMYQQSVVRVPLNKPNIRKIYSRKVFATQEQKWEAIVEEIEEMHALGRPVLVGTRSVSSSEELAERLMEKGLFCRVLNALRHEEEAHIVENAGQEKTITVATNMAGRGTDIALGYNVEALGGLHVIASECHESPRIDRQLFGRASRQGEAGSGRAYVSCDDELMRRYIPAQILEPLKKGLLLKIPSTELAVKRAVRWAQNAAQKQAYKNRRSVLKMDTWLEDSLSFIPKNYM